jgi:hypothetical protein
VPVVFIGDAVIGGSKWTSTSTCSLGTSSNAGAYSSVKRTYVAYPVGSPKTWKSMSVGLWPVVAGTQPAGSVLRKIVAMNYSAVTPGGIPSATVANNMLRMDADSTSFTGDSLIMWALYAPTITNAKPIIFVESGGSAAQAGWQLPGGNSADRGNTGRSDGARDRGLTLRSARETSNEACRPIAGDVQCGE